MNYGLMNINTWFIFRGRTNLRSALDGSGEIKKEWRALAEIEGFDTVKDWIKKELALVDYELETRRRLD